MHNILLSALLDRLEQADLLLATQGSFDIHKVSIDHLANDSRKVGSGGLFVAIHGEATDGHLFIDKAVQNEAIAVVCEVIPEGVLRHAPGVAFVQVQDGRAALAELAAAFYGDPAHQLKMVGVTGTNGKTTTAYLIHHLLSTLGEKTGLIGTIEYRFGGGPVPATHTTPDTIDLNRMLREMVSAGCTTCVMEVSSHALAQHRVRAIPFEVGLFSNLTRDHLDYHRTFDEYLAAKKILFDLLSPESVALYNIDDPAGEKIVADTQAQTISYGQSEHADYVVDVLGNGVTGLRLRIDGSARTFRLVGLFNAYNLVAAYGAGRALGYDREVVLDVLAQAPPVPGRFEQYVFQDGTTVIVDYAHTPDALKNVLKTIRQTKTPESALWCVFGCGGDRDPTKRSIMGQIAEEYADHVVVTADNSRTESIDQILAHIREGMANPGAARWIEDRRAAIQEVAHHASAGDVILIAGKGHEPYQIIGTERFHFDDREEVQRLFQARGQV